MHRNCFGWKIDWLMIYNTWHLCSVLQSTKCFNTHLIWSPQSFHEVGRDYELPPFYWQGNWASKKALEKWSCVRGKEPRTLGPEEKRTITGVGRSWSSSKGKVPATSHRVSGEAGRVVSCLAALFWRTLDLPQQALFCLHLPFND